MFVPSLFIGVGGVGKNILLRARRLVIERYRRLDDLPSIRFLHVDTDVGRGADGQSDIALHVLGEDISFSDSERVELSKEISTQIKNGARAVKENEAVREWFRDDLPLDSNFKDGAGGVRYYGRLAFHYSVTQFRKSVHQALLDVVNANAKAATARTLGDDPDTSVCVYIVCSLLGGTGSGTFLEVAYNVREVIASTGLAGKVTGVFVIGGAPENVSKANCYAALKELDYYSSAALQRREGFSVRYPFPGVTPIQRSEPPVDICYLADATNERGVRFNRNQLEETIAANLFFEFSSGIAEAKRSKRVDMIGKTPGYFVPDGRLGRSQQYFTFGLAVLEFPAPRIQEMLASNLASEVLREWLFEKAGANMNPVAAVRDFLRENRLDEKDCVADLLTAGGQLLTSLVESNLQNQERDVNVLIDGAGFDRNAIVASAHGHIELDLKSVTFSSDPKQCGTIAATVVANMEQKLRVSTAALRKRVADYVSNEHQGPGAAAKFLNALLSDLDGKASAYARQFGSFEKSAAKSQAAVYNELAALDRDCAPKFASETRYHNSQLHRVRLKDSAAKSLSREAYRAAAALLRQDYTVQGETVMCLVSLVRVLLSQVEAYCSKLQTLSKSFADEADRIEETLVNNPVADSLSITRDRLRQLSHEIVPNPAQHVTPVRDAVEADLGERSSLGDLVRPMPVIEAVLKLEADATRAVARACGEICSRARRISIAAELMRLDDRLSVITQRFQHSGVLLQLTGLDASVGHDPENSHREWLATTNPDRDPELNRVLGDILAVHSYGLVVKTLPEPYQIIFAEEKGIFPLRCVSALEEYKRIYDQYNQQAVAVPRESDKRIAFPDVLPEDERYEAIRRRAAGAALLGRLFGCFVKDKDPQTEYDRIYLTFFESENRTQQSLDVAGDWSDLQEALAAPQIARDIERKHVSFCPLEMVERLIAGRGRDATTKSKREELWLDLQAHLSDLECTLPGGTKNAAFTADLDIIRNFREKYRLAAPSADGERPSETKSKVPEISTANGAGAAFRHIVRTMVDASGGALGPAQQKVVETRRRGLGLSEGEAQDIITEILLGGRTNGRHEYANVILATYDGQNDLDTFRGDLNAERTRLRLSPEDAIEIENGVIDYCDLFAAMLNVASTDWARAELRARQSELRLADAVVNEIEQHVRSKSA